MEEASGNSAEKKAAIRVKDLRAQYGSFLILDKVSFTVKEAQRFFIVGGSGCGKSTLLRHMVGLSAPASGQVWIGEDNLYGGSEKTFKRLLIRMGVLFQSGALIGSLTVAENIRLPLETYTDLSREAIARLVDLKLELVDLGGYGDHLPSELSGGMKKRAGMARAMALNPRILFLDEPTAGLDPVTSAEMDRLILRLNTELSATMVIVTHDLASIFNLAENVVMLDRKKKRDHRQRQPGGDEGKPRDPVLFHPIGKGWRIGTC